MKHDATIAVDRRVDLRLGPQRGDDDRHAIFAAKLQILLQSGIGSVDDQVNREWGISVRQFRRQPLQPLFEHPRWPGVERGKGADHTGPTLRHHQIGLRNDEHRGCDGRKRKPILKTIQQGHGISGSFTIIIMRRSGTRIPGGCKVHNDLPACLLAFEGRKSGRQASQCPSICHAVASMPERNFSPGREGQNQKRMPMTRLATDALSPAARA
jgi:hypothetical protein